MRLSAIASLALSSVLLATLPEGGAAQGAAAKCVQEPNGDSSMDRQCWDGGKRRGRWVVRLPGGEVREGSYVAGKKEGHWVIRFADGGVQEGSYVAGVKQGRWVLRYADGAVEEGSVVDGLREGRWVQRRPDGSGRTFDMDGGALVADSVSARNAADLRAAAGADDNFLLVRQILDEGVSPNAPDSKGWTAVHVAAAGSAAQNLAVLLANGGDPDVQDGEGNTPLHLAANLDTPAGRDERKATAALRILLEGGASPNIANKAGDTPLHLAARSGVLHDASSVKALLAAGASPDKTNGRGNTPLHAAVEAYSRSSAEVVAALLEAGANPRAAGRDRLTPLLMFVRQGPDEGGVVTLLVNAGANPDRKAPDGDTPLHTAIREGGNRGKVEVVDALLAGGADPCIEDSRGFIPYNVATEGGIIHQALDRAHGYERACDKRDEAEARRLAEAERKEREAEARRLAEAERKEREAEARRLAAERIPECSRALFNWGSTHYEGSDYEYTAPASAGGGATTLCWRAVANWPECRFFMGVGPLRVYVHDAYVGLAAYRKDYDYEWTGTCVDGLAHGAGELVGRFPDDAWSGRDEFHVLRGELKQGKLNGVWEHSRFHGKHEVAAGNYARCLGEADPGMGSCDEWVTRATYSDGIVVPGSVVRRVHTVYNRGGKLGSEVFEGRAKIVNR